MQSVQENMYVRLNEQVTLIACPFLEIKDRSFLLKQHRCRKGPNIVPHRASSDVL